MLTFEGGWPDGHGSDLLPGEDVLHRLNDDGLCLEGGGMHDGEGYHWFGLDGDLGCMMNGSLYGL